MKIFINAKKKVYFMGDWDSIFRKKGKVFFKPHEDMRRVIKLMKNDGVNRVLDLGCGSGRHTVLLAKLGFDVYGMDISKSGLRQTRSWLKESRLKARLKEASCYKRFPFKDDFFDAIISVQVIQHGRIKDVRFCISEIERVLKPGGLVFITVPKPRNKIGTSKHKAVEPRTYILTEGEEKGLPHYFYNKSLLRKDFKNFKILDLYLDKTRHDKTRHYCLLGKLKSHQGLAL